MSSSVTIDPSTNSSQGPSSAATRRLLTRLTGVRNPVTAGGVDPAGKSSADIPVPSVAQVHNSSSSGDMLETLPEFSTARKPKEEVKKITVPDIPSRIEIELLVNFRKEHSSYNTEVSPPPQLDIRV